MMFKFKQAALYTAFPSEGGLCLYGYSAHYRPDILMQIKAQYLLVINTEL